MSIERTATGHRVRWRDPRNRARNFQTLKAAEAFERTVKDLKAAGRLHELDLVPPGEMTLYEYAHEVWWPNYAEVKLAPATKILYASQLDLRIDPRWGDTKLRDIKPRGVQDWITKMREDGVPDPTILKALSVLQGILRRAVIDDEIPSNPIQFVDKPSGERTRDPVAISPLMVERVRANLLSPEPTIDRRGIPHPRANEHLRLRNATLVFLLAYAGPRPYSEAIPMIWDQVGARSLTIIATKSGKRVERSVTKLEPLADDLNTWWQACGMPGKNEPVFPGNWAKTNWDSWRQNVWKPAAGRAGLPQDAIPRDLRGSFASLLISEGVNPILIARQLGHLPSELMDTYGRLFAEADGVGVGRPAVDVIREARETVERDWLAANGGENRAL